MLVARVDWHVCNTIRNKSFDSTYHAGNGRTGNVFSLDGLDARVEFIVKEAFTGVFAGTARAVTECEFHRVRIPNGVKTEIVWAPSGVAATRSRTLSQLKWMCV